ncbi:MAG: hypothetical protein WBM00_12115 [Solirubrobacterales bacterium]
MDLNRLNRGEKIAAGSAIALFIIMFLSWYTVDTPAGIPSPTLSAWDAYSFIDIILLVTIVAAVGAAVLRASDADIDVPASQIVTALGALSVLLILFRIISTPSWSAFGVDVADSSVTYGVILGLIAAVGIAFGGYSSMQEEGASFGDAAARLSGGAGTGDGPSSGPPSPPPPPPPSSTPPSPPPPPPPASS